MGSEPHAELIASLQAAADAVPAVWDESASQAEDDPEYRSAKKRAYSILAMRDHSRVELRDKLVKREHPAETVEVLLDRLEAANLLDDASFARQLVRSQREQKGLSAAALRRRLRDKGVAEDIAQEALEELDDDYPHALVLAQKKAGSTRGLEYEVRLRRVLGLLGRRGFGGSTAMRAAREALGEDPE